MHENDLALGNFGFCFSGKGVDVDTVVRVNVVRIN
jgi:hypothetical protein